VFSALAQRIIEPCRQTLFPEAALKTDKFLLMLYGMAAEGETAKDIIESTRPVNVTSHSAELAAADV
jgi:hypothetical protein